PLESDRRLVRSAPGRVMGALPSVSSGLHKGLAPSRTSLDNGVVVLAKRTVTTPAVAIHLAVRAGSAYDPTGAAGAMWLLSRAIDRGAAARSAADIADR